MNGDVDDAVDIAVEDLFSFEPRESVDSKIEYVIIYHKLPKKKFFKCLKSDLYKTTIKGKKV